MLPFSDKTCKLSTYFAFLKMFKIFIFKIRQIIWCLTNLWHFLARVSPRSIRLWRTGADMPSWVTGRSDAVTLVCWSPPHRGKNYDAVTNNKGEKWTWAPPRICCRGRGGWVDVLRAQIIINCRCPSEDNDPDYWVLPIFAFFIISGVFGNILVCLAISTNR